MTRQFQVKCPNCETTYPLHRVMRLRLLPGAPDGAVAICPMCDRKERPAYVGEGSQHAVWDVENEGKEQRSPGSNEIVQRFEDWHGLYEWLKATSRGHLVAEIREQMKTAAYDRTMSHNPHAPISIRFNDNVRVHYQDNDATKSRITYIEKT